MLKKNRAAGVRNVVVYKSKLRGMRVKNKLLAAIVIITTLLLLGMIMIEVALIFRVC